MMDHCLSRETIERYVQQLCSQSDAQEVEAHVAGCEACRKRVEFARARNPAGDRDAGGGRQKEDREAGAPPEAGQDPEATVVKPASAPEEVFEGYLNLGEIGQGGQGQVFKALHKETNQVVALKTLTAAGLASEEKRRRFEREVAVIEHLDHPNIVKIRGCGLGRKQYYFTMDYIRGQPLDTYLHSRTPPLSLHDKLTLFLRICDAVKSAHGMGVIHRDLKPANILVDERAEPHILDFGVAKIVDSLDAQGRTPAVTQDKCPGTPDYMSPEQAAGRPDRVNVQSDIYSLGVILYEMCTGRFPYDVSGSTEDKLRNVQQVEPVRPRRVIRGFNSEVETIILKCLAKDCGQRYQTAAQLKDDVQNWLGGDPIVAKSPNPVYVLRKWAGRHRYGAAVLGSLLVILCSFASLSLHFYHGKNEYGKENKQLKAALDDRNQLLIYQDPFFAFLEGWRSPKPEKAAAAASLRNRLPPRSLYRRAADFLLDPNAAGRIESFRAELPPQASWLADWMVAEVRRKCQDHSGAIAAYKTCHEAMSTAQGRPFQQYVEAALYRLMSDPGDSLPPRERPTGKEKP